MGKYVKAAQQKVPGMETWWRDVNRKPPKKPSRDGRTHAEVLWDNGVFAAAELVRRLTDSDDLCLAIHELCHWKRRDREKEDSGPSA